MKDIILYHGSRGGIEGPIRPSSRERCDFGRGFYLGTNPLQVKGLVINDPAPMFYECRLKLSEIPEDRILVLSGQQWIEVVLANRKKCEEFNGLRLAKRWLEDLNNYDVVIGPIADDRMNYAIQRFSEYTLTDKALEACLSKVNYGMQYVLKTEFACSKVEILLERDIYGSELSQIRNYSDRMRNYHRHLRIPSCDIVNIG